MGERNPKTLSVSMLHPPKSSLTMLTWNTENISSRSCASKTSYQLILSPIIINRSLLNDFYRYIRRPKTPSWTVLLLLDMCAYVIFCFGLVYPAAWVNMYMEVTMIIIFSLGPPMISYGSCN